MYLSRFVPSFSEEIEKISMDKAMLKTVGKWAGGGAALGGLLGGIPSRHQETDRKFSRGERVGNAALGAIGGGLSGGLIGHSVHTLDSALGAIHPPTRPKPPGPKKPPVGPRPEAPMGKVLPFKKLAFALPTNPTARGALLSAAAGAAVGGVAGAAKPMAQDDYGNIYKPTVADRFAGFGQGAFRGGLAGGAIGAAGSHYLGK